MEEEQTRILETEPQYRSKRSELSSISAKFMKTLKTQTAIFKKQYGRQYLVFQWIYLLSTLSIITLIGFLLVGNTIFGDFGTQNKIISENNKPVKANPNYCQNTVQGKTWLTDDKGYVCKWKEFEPTSRCCNSSTNIARYSCHRDYCNVNDHCCNVYEFCVSCCMHPNHFELKTNVVSSASNPLLKTTESHFDYCRSVCRTNSRSLLGKNIYRSDKKFCYGVNAPPLQNESSIIDSQSEFNNNNNKVEPYDPIISDNNDNNNNNNDFPSASDFINNNDDPFSVGNNVGVKSSDGSRFSGMKSWLRDILITLLLIGVSQFVV